MLSLGKRLNKLEGKTSSDNKLIIWSAVGSSEPARAYTESECFDLKGKHFDLFRDCRKALEQPATGYPLTPDKPFKVSAADRQKIINKYPNVKPASIDDVIRIAEFLENDC